MEKKMIWSSEMLYDDEARENYLENMRAITENKDYQLTDGKAEEMPFNFLVTTLPTYFIPDARMPNGTAMPTTYVEYCTTMMAPTMCFTA